MTTPSLPEPIAEAIQSLRADIANSPSRFSVLVDPICLKKLINAYLSLVYERATLSAEAANATPPPQDWERR